ncbi:MAG: 2-hydroxyglutaryl-CoA dehydratase [Deltaproteobacteria bacterium]|nr:2-hydroxyglutaryl-CoA dehydratase [Deltaproteobacteria bacterium]
MFFAGIDIGSLTAKTVIIDDEFRIIGRSIFPTGAVSERAGKESFQNALEKASLNRDDIASIIGTGYGRKNIPFADGEVTEITCHARGAHHLFPETRTIIDIGGQDSKVISVNDMGRPVNFTMNDKCAAGSGRFLEVMAKALETDLDKMGELSLQSQKKVEISSMCTVFAESEVVSAVASGHDSRDILNGIHQAIARRVSVMVQHVGIKEKVTMTGGVAKNIGVVKALEKELSTKIFIPADPQIIGALGAAIIAMERYLASKGNDQSVHYTSSKVYEAN